MAAIGYARLGTKGEVEPGAYGWSDSFRSTVELYERWLDAKEEVERLKAAGLAMTAIKDAAYAERNRVVCALASMADQMGMAVSVIQHEDKPGEKWEDDWRTVLVIELPTGQVTWHFHDSEKHLLPRVKSQHHRPYDGHTTDEKYQRLQEYVETE